MSSVMRLDKEKLRTRRVIATAMLTVVTVAFLLLTDKSGPVSATPPAAEAEQTRPGGTPQEPAALDQNPADPTGGKKLQTASTARPVRPQEE